MKSSSRPRKHGEVHTEGYEHTVPGRLKLKKSAADAFLKLCGLICKNHPTAETSVPGCPCDTLAFWLDLLRKGPATLKEERLDVHSMDSYDAALGEFTLADIDKLIASAQRLVEQVDLLKRTPLVRQIQQDGHFNKWDLLANGIFTDSAPFTGLLKLRRLARDILGDARNPFRVDYDDSLTHAYKTIHDESGYWYDGLMAEILTDLCDEPHTQSGLKQWRFRRSLVDPK